MNDLPSLLLMVFAGALLAGLYLVGLWLTVRDIHHQRHPALWLLLSIMLRMGLVLVVFYLILGDHRWSLLLAVLFGFIAIRTVAIGWLRHRKPQCGTDKRKAA